MSSTSKKPSEKGVGEPVPLRTEEVKGRVNPDSLLHTYRKYPFYKGILEPLKNSYDAGATRIWIDTTSKDVFIIRDNGLGMNKDSREAYVCSGESTSRGNADKTGNWGTGKIRFTLPLAMNVVVLTAPADEPDVVYRVEFDVDDFFRKLLKEESFSWECFDRTSETWPYGHEHESGSVITYTIRKKKVNQYMRDKRGEKLAENLSGILSGMLGSLVRVDGNPLPKRKLVGEYIESYTRLRGRLGEVNFDLFNPDQKHRRSGDSLRLSGSVVGEVSFMSTLYPMLPQSLKLAVHPVFQHPDCCGMITCPVLFEEYGCEDRTSLDEGILDDPRLEVFLKFLNSKAEDIAKRLKIKLKSDVSSASDDDMLHSVAELFHKTWGGGEQDGPSDGPDVPPEDDEPTIAGQPKKFYLNVEASHGLSQREIGIGEHVDIMPVKNHDSLTPAMARRKVTWQITGVAHKVEELKDGGRRIIPVDESGVIEVKAWLGEALRAGCRIIVAKKRKVRLNTTLHGMKVGTSYRLRLLNADMKGNRKVQWENESPARGNLVPASDGLSALFTATGRGTVPVTVTIGGKSDEGLNCQFNVHSDEHKQITIKIDEHSFVIRNRSFAATVPLVRVSVNDKPEMPGEVVVNTGHESYKANIKSSPDVMRTIIMQEIITQYVVGRIAFPRFQPESSVQPHGIKAYLMHNVLNHVNRLMNQLMGQMKLIDNSSKSSKKSKKK